MPSDGSCFERIRGYLARPFSDLVMLTSARSDAPDVECALALALHMVPTAPYRALTWRRGNRYAVTVASVGRVADTVQRLQLVTRQGPTLEVLDGAAVVRVADLGPVTKVCGASGR